MNYPNGQAAQQYSHPHPQPAPPFHPHARRQPDYYAYHAPPPPAPMHHQPPNPYAGYAHPAQFYPHPPPHYQPRWQHPYQPPIPYMTPQPPQPPFQPRSPMVVSSQPFPTNPATRHTPVPHFYPQPQAGPPSQPLPHLMQQQLHTPVAPPSPAPTPKQEQEQRPPSQQPEAPPPPQTPTRQPAVHPLSLSPEYTMPDYRKLPWYSVPELPFPRRAPRRRRRRQNLDSIQSKPVTLPDQGTTGEVVLLPHDDGASDASTIGQAKDKMPPTLHPPPSAPIETQDAQQQVSDEPTSETSTVEAPSEPQTPAQAETPATSQAPSESDLAETPATVVQESPSAKKSTPQGQHARKDTRTFIAVPNISGPARPKPSPAAGGKQEDKQASPSPSTDATSPSGETQKLSSESDGKSAADGTTPVSPLSKPVASWAEMVKRNTTISSSGGLSNAGTTTASAMLPKSASLADALKQYSVQIDSTLSFLEPRGLVNTGNMCYMNSILQVLVFCVPFYNFLDQVRQRTVHSMKSDTPLLDAMIMFMKEFRVLANAESVIALRKLLTQQQLEQYGDPVTPEYVYDAIRKLNRFNSMRRGHQQDAEEFMGFLLEGLHDECVAVMRGQIDAKVEDKGVKSPIEPMSPNSADGWLEVGPKQKASVTRTAGQQDAPSPITKIFGGHLRSELRVPGQKDSVTLEPYKALPLDVGAAHVNNILDALKGLTRIESLTGDFGGRGNSARKQVFIESFPPILILHLKRFQYQNNGTEKIYKKVGYPLELEIPKDVIQPSKRGGLAVKGGLPKYRLISVVYHHGKSAAGGHYTVDVLREDGQEWIRMDDTVIRRIRSQDVAEGGAEEDPKVLAKALEQHKADQELQQQRNMYQGLDEAEREPEEEKPWSEVNGHAPGHKKWSSVANATTNGTSTPSTTGKRTPAKKSDGVRDNKVAYILFYERVRG